MKNIKMMCSRYTRYTRNFSKYYVNFIFACKFSSNSSIAFLTKI